MKKKFLFITLVLLGFINLQSQSNYEIDSTSVWIQEEIHGGMSNWSERNYSLSIQGDTSINDTTFFKMFLNGQKVYTDHGGSITILLSNLYFGAVYDSNGDIYFIPPDSLYSTHLYNFDYELHDTIYTHVGKGLIIIGIDTLADGRKRFQTNGNPFHVIVEGIGSTNGFYLAYFLSQLEAIVDTTLGCYYQYDSLVFLNDSSVCYFSLPVAINENSRHDASKIYPNPAKSTILVEVNYKINDLVVYDIYGNKLHVDYFPPNKVDIAKLPPGCYILSINNKHHMKFIKK